MTEKTENKVIKQNTQKEENDNQEQENKKPSDKFYK